jgi:spore coat polysaccharide biosynthesis protein SpsF (cytidylyltransferase family)
LLSVLIKKLKRSRKVKDTVVATTKKKEDNKITNFCRTNSIQFFRGSKNDVLNRYYETAKTFDIKTLSELQVIAL